jgi:hypothetical protein
MLRMSLGGLNCLSKSGGGDDGSLPPRPVQSEGKSERSSSEMPAAYATGRKIPSFLRKLRDNFSTFKGGQSLHPASGNATKLATSEIKPSLPSADTEVSAPAVNETRLETSEGRLRYGKGVLEDVRRVYKDSEFKASNKIRAGLDSVQEEERIKKAVAETDKVFAQFTNVSKATELASKAQGHNCYTLSLLALDKLKSQGVESRMLSTTAHACVAMGSIPKGKLPEDMRQWPSDIGICDPWANIICAAPDYPNLFEAKMAKWKEAGKVLIDGDNKRIAPDDPNWMTEVLRAPRMISKGDFWPDS